MPSYQAQKKQPEVNTPMELPEEDQTFSLGFGRNNFGENLGLLNSDTESAKTEDYGFNLPELEKQKINSNQARGPLISTPENSRNLLYKYLEDRRKSEPDFQEAYQDRTRDAETGRVLNTFASGLGEAASMAGTLGGKRSQTGDMKALPNAIYNAQKNKADELMGLRRLSNQEQRGDIQMLRDLERGDLDNLRMQKILAELDRQKNQPKITPFYNFGDPDNNVPPSAMVMDNQGKFSSQNLPMGTMPTNSGYSAGPTLYDQQNNPILSQAQKSTGQYKFTPGPAGTKTTEIKRIENDSEAKAASLEMTRLRNEMTNANAQEKIDLQRKVFELDKKIQGWKESQGNRTGDQADRRLDIMEDKNNQDKNDGSKTSEGERKSALFSTVLLDSLKQIEDMENGNPELGLKPYRPGARSTAGNMFGGSGSVLGNRVLGDEDRAYDTLANTLIEPILRSWTGAAAQKDEIKREWSKSKIVPGDDEKTIKIKQNARRVYAKGLVESSGRAKGSIEGSQSSGGSSGSSGRVVAEKKYSPSRNKTKITYSDGSTETVEGRK